MVAAAELLHISQPAVMEVVYFRVVLRLGHWLWVSVLVSCIVRRTGALFERAGSRWRSSAAGLPPMGQQLPNSAVDLRRQPGEHVLEVSPWVMPVELGRLCRPPNYAERHRLSWDSP